MTSDANLNSSLRKLKDFGRSSGGNDLHDSVGFNFKFTDMQAVIGLTQMGKLQWRINRKKEIFKRYHDKLVNLENINYLLMI